MVQIPPGSLSEQLPTKTLNHTIIYKTHHLVGFMLVSEAGVGSLCSPDPAVPRSKSKTRQVNTCCFLFYRKSQAGLDFLKNKKPTLSVGFAFSGDLAGV